MLGFLTKNFQFFSEIWQYYFSVKCDYQIIPNMKLYIKRWKEFRCGWSNGLLLVKIMIFFLKNSYLQRAPSPDIDDFQNWNFWVCFLDVQSISVKMICNMLSPRFITNLPKIPETCLEHFGKLFVMRYGRAMVNIFVQFVREYMRTFQLNSVLSESLLRLNIWTPFLKQFHLALFEKKWILLKIMLIFTCGLCLN